MLVLQPGCGPRRAAMRPSQTGGRGGAGRPVQPDMTHSACMDKGVGSRPLWDTGALGVWGEAGEYRLEAERRCASCR